MTGSCSECLRRGHLVGHLAPRIAALLDRPARRAPGLLGLSDEELIAAVAGPHTGDAHRFLATFSAAGAHERLAEAGVEPVCRHSPAYPPPLLQLADHPIVLFVRGRAERLAELASSRMVTVVGSRRASPYGLEVARELGRGLSAAGVPVVSGLAMGIDGAAHRGAVEREGGAVAVLAGGPDVPHPRLNRRLYERVLERGVVVSELPPGQRAYRWSFPARNRIMAGLAALTVVVEAAKPSGSLMTAEVAQDLGRELVAVPGNVTLAQAAGSNELLREGARVVRGTGDVLDDLHGPGNWERPADVTDTQDLEPPLRRVLQAVEAGHGPEAVGRAAGASAAEVRAALGRLELLGLVARGPFGSYRRTAVG